MIFAVIRWLPALLLCGLAAAAHGQTADNALFRGARDARAAADAANASSLSPRTWQQASSAYEKAQADFGKGNSTERIQQNLNKAELDFRKARDNAENAALLLRSAMESRQAAKAADAERLVPAEFATAEKLFAEATTRLERGDTEDATLVGAQADDTFQQAELNALRVRYLTGARTLLADADKAKVDRSAPRTLARARQLLDAADAALVGDRYDTAKAEALAALAESEARHAIYTGALVNLVAKKTLTTEDVIISWEETLIEIAAALEIEADLSAGETDTRDRIIAKAEDLLELPAIVAERNAQILGLEDELRELDTRIARTSADRASLIRQVERQARIREQFNQIRNTFLEDEAIVLRDGDNLIIRLVGLTFSSNSAELQPGIEALMDKVKSAIAVFPQCRLTVEGHTDSQGAVENNLALSERRAQTVKRYMTDELLIPEFRIEAVAYGDSRPLTSNRSAEGRAQNRRIDLIIMPSPDSL